MPEHAERLDCIPDAVLIEQEKRRTALRVEVFREKMQVARDRAS
jgi:hypothetical protein